MFVFHGGVDIHISMLNALLPTVRLYISGRWEVRR